MKKQILSPTGLRLWTALICMSVTARANAHQAQAGPLLKKTVPVLSVPVLPPASFTPGSFPTGLPVSDIPRQADSLVNRDPVISFLGSDEEYYFFRVQIANPGALLQEITLTDKSNGTVLYSDFFSGTYFVKRIAVPRDMTDLQWDLRSRPSKGKGIKTSFSLVTEVKLKENVSITRL